MTEYRKRIYGAYVSHFQNSTSTFDEEQSHRWGAAYDYYFRGWMPNDKEVSIIDVGCGGGKLLYFFKQRGYTNVSGVDISAEQVTLARQVCRHVHEDNVLKFLQAHPNTFDLITGLDIIEHLHKDEVLRFIDGSFLALKPGGRIILQTLNAESPWCSAVRYGDFTHEGCFTPNLLRSLLEGSKYSDVLAREQCPIPLGYSIISTLRFIVWQGMRQIFKFCNMVETGHAGSCVFSRVFLITAKKPQQ
jgi:2-polyprenyl-3-methyl-5-hydroxy-6-metoxy-1,4-benzoquinol methylase